MTILAKDKPRDAQKPPPETGVDGSVAIGEHYSQLPEITEPRLVEIVQYRLDGKTWDEISGLLKIATKTLWNWRQAHSIDELIEQIANDSLESVRRKHIKNARKTAARIGDLLDSDDREDWKWAIDRMLIFPLAAKAHGGGSDAADKIREAATDELLDRARKLRQLGKGGKP